MIDYLDVDLSVWAEQEIDSLLDAMPDPDMRRVWDKKLRKIFGRKAENAGENQASFNEAFERALRLGIEDPLSYSQVAVMYAVREKINAYIRKRIAAGLKKGERLAANKEAEALERASRTASPKQRRRAQDDRKYLDIVGSAEKDASLASSGLVRSKIEKQIGAYSLPHWEKTTIALKVMALSCETAKRGGRAINLRISDAMSDKALSSQRGPVSFVQNQVRETLKRRFAADAPEFWFVMERDNDRRFHLHGAYETADHIDHRLVDAALRDAGGWSADAGKGTAQLSRPLTEPLFWASYVVKTINLTSTMTDRKLLGSTAEIKTSARGGWDALSGGLPKA
ncbi:MAG: hypothetical protein P0Y50_13800 [Candidatus Brevundimonas colombiensis]|uniref:Uncharacterized protein n=1 Tax=Candidatus Brevundimonas colombiensis TaxID=3121376 RepID=A0AAJ6BKU7_9CAUL|nr:hypothetical protein [Brevundimonas sp.]WEK39592.1 MAG: hypothetical protein P0Y50_13800 [Brevundimonas sp.]